VPGGFDRAHFGAGAMVGTQTLAAGVAERLGGRDAGGRSHAVDPVAGASFTMPPGRLDVDLPLRRSGRSGARRVRDKAFVDFQSDVAVDDVDLAHREGYQSVEHLKRYTTLGMGTDQGKTSNLNAWRSWRRGAACRCRRSAPPPSARPTRRSPSARWPGAVWRAHLAGGAAHRHARLAREHGGMMMEAGAWKRPLWYRGAGATLSEAYKAEMDIVREQVGIADVSTLGKIDVQGPDAAEFLNRVYVNGFAKLPVGKARYGFMLREDGIVLDDGTTSRLGETEFFMTTTTAQAGRVMSHLEFLLQVVWPELRVTVASVSDQWAAMSMAGPEVARGAAGRIPAHRHPYRGARPHGGARHRPHGALAGIRVRIIRLTFSGELAYEVYAPTHHGRRIWEHLLEAGKPWNLRPYGLEALGSLRIEKGHVTGSEMDGRTTLDDMGMGKMASQIKPFWGDALRRARNLARKDRPTLVGLEAIGRRMARRPMVRSCFCRRCDPGPWARPHHVHHLQQAAGQGDRAAGRGCSKAAWPRGAGGHCGIAGAQPPIPAAGGRSVFPGCRGRALPWLDAAREYGVTLKSTG
jgi:glycine cleavage system aminomethyltransferase T